jgi:hypothetical protein
MRAALVCSGDSNSNRGHSAIHANICLYGVRGSNITVRIDPRMRARAPGHASPPPRALAYTRPPLDDPVAVRAHGTYPHVPCTRCTCTAARLTRYRCTTAVALLCTAHTGYTAQLTQHCTATGDPRYKRNADFGPLACRRIGTLRRSRPYTGLPPWCPRPEVPTSRARAPRVISPCPPGESPAPGRTRRAAWSARDEFSLACRCIPHRTSKPCAASHSLLHREDSPPPPLLPHLASDEAPRRRARALHGTIRWCVSTPTPRGGPSSPAALPLCAPRPRRGV